MAVVCNCQSPANVLHPGKEITPGKRDGSVDVAGRGVHRQAPNRGSIVLHADDDEDPDPDIHEEAQDGGGQEGPEGSDQG